MNFQAKHIFWVVSNVFGYAFGFRFLAPIHHAVVTLGLHALGYDNAHPLSSSGEEWFIKKVLARSDAGVSIDVGANVGDYAALLLWYTKGTVYAIEPLSSTFATLQKKASDRMHVSRCAIAEFDGTAQIFSQAEGWQGATLSKELVQTKTISEEVPVMTLDSFVEKNNIQNITFIKVDTEGHEKEVFLGMQKILKKSPPKFIQFEFNILHLTRGHTLLSLTQLLPDYTFYRLLPHGMVKIDPEKYINNIFMFSNIIAKRLV
jgi:FkbM family methyltransferase